MFSVLLIYIHYIFQPNSSFAGLHIGFSVGLYKTTANATGSFYIGTVQPHMCSVFVVFGG
jgi:hypothetical protein